MKRLLLFLSLFLITTAAFGVDKTFKAPSGNLILDANDDIVVKQSLGINIVEPTQALDVYTNNAAAFGGIRIYNDASDGTGGLGIGDHNGTIQNMLYSNGAGKLFLDSIYGNAIDVRVNVNTSPVTAMSINGTTGELKIGTPTGTSELLTVGKNYSSDPGSVPMVLFDSGNWDNGDVPIFTIYGLNNEAPTSGSKNITNLEIMAVGILIMAMLIFTVKLLQEVQVPLAEIHNLS